MDGPKTSFSLLEHAKQKNGEAWEKIVFVYAPLVSFWCERKGLKFDEIQNVGQEVFLSAYRSLGTFVPKQETRSFRSWLHKITLSKVYDNHKVNVKHKSFGGVESIDADECSELELSEEGQLSLRESLSRSGSTSPTATLTSSST